MYKDVLGIVNASLITAPHTVPAAVTLIVLNSPLVWKLFEHVHLPNFDIASDAFTIIQDLLTRHKERASVFIKDNYDQLFAECCAHTRL